MLGYSCREMGALSILTPCEQQAGRGQDLPVDKRNRITITLSRKDDDINRDGVGSGRLGPVGVNSCHVERINRDSCRKWREEHFKDHEPFDIRRGVNQWWNGDPQVTIDVSANNFHRPV